MTAHPPYQNNDSPNAPYPAVNELAPRLQWFKNELDRCYDAVFHTFELHGRECCALIYFQGLFDYKSIQDNLLEPLMATPSLNAGNVARYLFEQKGVPLAHCPVTGDSLEALNGVLQGHGVLLVEGSPQMMLLPFNDFETRAVEESMNESVIRGPKEAFVESLATNLTMLRRQIRSSRFKTEQFIVGAHTRTPVVIAYLEGVCRDSLVEEVKRRISCIELNSVLGSNYIVEAIQDNPISPFPQIQFTERPDTVSASILEGRVAVLCDHTPIAFIAPVTFFMMLQSAEDYYLPFIASSWIRWIRYAFLAISLLLPSFYIAVSTFHPEMIPFNLLVSVSSSREIVPFPALMEAFMMEIAFEALREASVRIPKSVGQAVSIIGALIIGTAAVQAGIVSAAMVIIVSVTGIASFIIPNFDLGLSLRLLRFPMMLLAGFFGIYGIACGLILIYVHMINLTSFGTPYLMPWTPRIDSSLKDVFVRFPWWSMRSMPFTARKGSQRYTGQPRGWVRDRKENEFE